MDIKKEHPKYPLEKEQEEQIKASYDYIKSLQVEEFMNVHLFHILGTSHPPNL